MRIAAGMVLTAAVLISCPAALDAAEESPLAVGKIRVRPLETVKPAPAKPVAPAEKQTSTVPQPTRAAVQAKAPAADEYGDVAADELRDVPTAGPKKSTDEYGDVTADDLDDSGRSGPRKAGDEYGDIVADDGTAPAGPGQVADPIKPFNLAMYQFNDKVYFWVWKPIATGYEGILPTEIRGLFSNFYENLKAPIRIFNNLMQGEADDAGVEFVSFFINSTIGVGGLRNCAQECFGLNRRYADFGQTLGKWGLGHGFYVVVPFFGPSSVRDGIGMLVDWPLRPTAYVGDNFISPESVGLFIHDKINYTSFHLGEYEALKDASVDPYVAMRDAYIQFRNNLIKRK